MAIHIVSRAGSSDFIKMLIEAGALCDARNVVGDTPLTLAAMSGSKDAVLALLPHVNACERGRDGITSLAAAAIGGNPHALASVMKKVGEETRESWDEEGHRWVFACTAVAKLSAWNEHTHHISTETMARLL